MSNEGKYRWFATSADASDGQRGYDFTGSETEALRRAQQLADKENSNVLVFVQFGTTAESLLKKVKPRLVDKMADNFQLKLVGPVFVSFKEDEGLTVVDGQARLAAAAIVAEREGKSVGPIEVKVIPRSMRDEIRKMLNEVRHAKKVDDE